MKGLTADQLRAVEADGVDLCVVAGAGTGKTRALTERIVHRLREGKLDLSRLLAITFTEKAAAEMKQRLARALADEGRADAAQAVERAAISTVHAFCARLLREHAVEACVDPAFTVLEPVEAERLFESCLDALVAEMAARHDPDLDRLAALPGSDPADTLGRIFRAARESGAPPAQFPLRRPELPDPAPHEAAVRAALRDLEPFTRTGSDAARGRAQAVLDAARPLDAATTAAGRVRVVDDMVAAVNLSTGKDLKAVLSMVREEGTAWLSILAEERLAPTREALSRALARLEALFEEAKGHGERLDFADLERRALALLEDDEAVRGDVRRRWTEVHVDEFQDTNPVQERLVAALHSPGSLFVVGDPRQSIYGFRGSDVGVFLRRMESVRGGGAEGLVDLRHSFRSRPEILGVVNALFPPGFGGVEAGELLAGREFPPKERPSVECFAVSADGATAARQAEARWIARRILDLVEGGDDVLEVTERDGTTRPSAFGDVAVLLRATPDVKILEHALTARGIPYLVLKGRGFFQAREVVDLANLLASVENPEDELTLAAVLRSPCCGISDDGLFALISRGREAGLANVLLHGGIDESGLGSDDLPRAQRFAQTLAELRAARGWAPPPEIVDLALSRTGLELYALARPGGRQRAANLRKVRGLALERHLRGAGGLADLVEEVRELRAREVRETEAPVSAAAGGAVSVLTVHASKGLEFPVVFVPDMARTGPAAGGSVVTHGTDGLGLAPSRGEELTARVRPHALSVMRERAVAREAQESERLLYVATTRAEQHLVLTAGISRGRTTGTWWDKVRTHIEGMEAGGIADLGPGADGGRTRAVVCVHPPEVVSWSGGMGGALLPRLAQELREGSLDARAVLPAAVEHAQRLVLESARPAPPPDLTLYETTVTALVTWARSPEEFHRRQTLRLPESLAELFPGAPCVAPDDAPPGPERAGDDEQDLSLDARALGRAAHLALERWVPEFDLPVADVVDEALRTETGGAAPDPAHARRLVRWVEGLRDSDLGRLVASLPRDDVRREQAFLFVHGRTTVRGQLDLVFRGPDGWTVVDYKAGAVGPSRSDQVLQMRLYALALRKVTGEAPAQLLLYSLEERRSVEVPCSARDLDEIEGGLLAQFTGTGRTPRSGSRARP